MSSLDASRKWCELGLPAAVLAARPDCVEYLVNSRLVYSLAGYHAGAGPEHPSMRVDRGELELKVEGVWRRWEEVQDLLRHGSRTYTSIRGFVLQDRLHYKAIFPVHLLSPHRYERVKAVAARFLETHADVDPGTPKSSVLQLITTSLNSGNSPFSLEHCTIRVLRPVEDQIEVYSFGAEMTEEEYRQTMPGGGDRPWLSPAILTTVETKIGMGDFMEFREAKLRRVTSIPLTAERAEKILQRVNRLSQSRIRFNYIGQNCLALAHEVMKETGYEMADIHMSLGQLVSATWLNRERYPRLAQLLEKENRLSMVISNCASIALGGLKMSQPMAEGAPEDPLGTNEGILSFSRLIRSPISLLTENGSRINYHSLPFIAWQMEQPSTELIVPIPGIPDLYGL